MQPVLSYEVFATRRKQLMAQLPDNSVVVLFAAEEKYRNNDVEYPFRQDSYFWYLTGFPEPNAVAVLKKSHKGVSYILFNAPRNPEREIWSGKIIGQQGAIDRYGVDIAYPLSEIHKLPGLIAECSNIYTVLGVSEYYDVRMTSFVRDVHTLVGRGGSELLGILDLRRVIDEMRMIKSKEEQELLYEAGRISALGHCAAMLATRPGEYEYTVQAVMEAEFLRNKGCHWAYGSIIAGGANACCLHYHDNNAQLQEGELVLFDAGAEYAGYAGDISRTIPISGKFSRDQQALYEVVLHAQKTAIQAARPGIRHLELHRQTAILLIQGMIDLNIISGNAEEWVDSGEAKRFYPHGTGHWLGLDVHDVGIYKPAGESRQYVPGMVITIEPGLYLQPDDMSIAEKWRGIGIRIEDNIIITSGAPEVTTSDVPKEVDEIERLLAERRYNC